MRQYKGRARAKLNLYLEVGPRREDGYHDLCTVFQTIDLYDKVAITVHDKGGISLKCNWPYLPTDNRNLAYRAAELFFAHTGKDNPGIYINMKKVIPVGAGMAGGSTDAAAVLRLLNRAFGYPLSKRELLELGLQLGADVPFCLMGGTMLAEGVGEQLSPLPDLPPCGIVVCKPGFSVATKKRMSCLMPVRRRQVPDLMGCGRRWNRGIWMLCAAICSIRWKRLWWRNIPPSAH